MLCSLDTHPEFRAMIRIVFLIEALQMLCILYEDSYASSVKYLCPFLVELGHYFLLLNCFLNLIPSAVPPHDNGR